MRFDVENPTRILTAPPGLDGQVKTGREIIMVNGMEVDPWRTVGVAPMLPQLTVTDGLITIIFDAAGSYEELEATGVGQQISLAFAQLIDGTPIFNVAPASLSTFKIQTDAGNQYRGQLAFQFLGKAREVPWEKTA